MSFPQLIMGFWIVSASIWCFILMAMYVRSLYEQWTGHKLSHEEFFGIGTGILVLCVFVTWMIA